MKWWHRSRVPTRLVTNAPAEWPLAALPADPGGVAPEAFDAFVADALRVLFRASGVRHVVSPVHEWALVPDGVLPVPFEVRAPDGARHPVFPYHAADAALAPAHWAGVTRALASVPGVRPVYYAPARLEDASAAPAEVTQRFTLDVLAPWNADPPRASLATWWATPDDPEPRASRAFRDVARAQDALAGCGSHVLGALVERLADAPRKGRRFALPDAPLVLHARAPDGRYVAFSASVTKGVRVHFDPVVTPAWWRDVFLAHWADHAERVRDALAARGVSLSVDAAHVAWWRDARAAATAAGARVEKFGVVAPRDRAA